MLTLYLLTQMPFSEQPTKEVIEKLSFIALMARLDGVALIMIHRLERAVMEVYVLHKTLLICTI
jgi:hypothetical protein